MLDRLERMKERFQEVGQLMVQPDAMAVYEQTFTPKLSKEYADFGKSSGGLCRIHQSGG